MPHDHVLGYHSACKSPLTSPNDTLTTPPDTLTRIWRTAFRNVLFSVPRPTSLTHFPPSALAALLFSGGHCMTCLRKTKAVPYSFALGIRFCSMACEFATLLRVPPTPQKAGVLPNALPELEHRNTLPVPIAYLEGSSELRLYAPARINAAWTAFARQYRNSPVVQMPLVTPVRSLLRLHFQAEAATIHRRLRQPILGWKSGWRRVNSYVDMHASLTSGQTAETLCAGARQYRIAKEEVAAENESLLTQLAHDLGFTLNQLTSSPTLALWVNILARDLQSFTRVAWIPIRDKVLFELDQRVCVNGTSIVCVFCPARRGGQPRRYSNEGLQRHFVSRHPEQVPAVIANRLEICPLCHKSKTTTYDRQSMIKHLMNMLVLPASRVS
ncbi:hypothetical protein DFH09DRAFT_1104718 [Mycena vulgaris]|nr:hypothetical protein DFH09DRAFT_1104718 [Mycena vulgaris]